MTKKRISNSYLAWSGVDYFSEDKRGNRQMASASSSKKMKRIYKRRSNIRGGSFMSTSDSGQIISDNEMDITLIPATSTNTNEVIDNQNVLVENY